MTQIHLGFFKKKIYLYEENRNITIMISKSNLLFMNYITSIYDLD